MSWGSKICAHCHNEAVMAVEYMGILHYEICESCYEKEKAEKGDKLVIVDDKESYNERMMHDRMSGGR